ncbi:hypothetical protein ACFL6T_01005 [Candidatus Zixiibacteriota bacterium]
MGRFSGIEPMITLVATICISATVISQEHPNPIVRVDHIVAQSTQAQHLYEFLHDELLLPEVWPFTDYGGFASGGLSLGNVVIEIIKWNETNSRLTDQATFQGIAFEPAGSASSTIEWMDQKSIGHSALDPYAINIDGEELVLWETFSIEVPPTISVIFVCDYKDREAFVQEPQAASSQALLNSGGGPVGILACREIVIAVTDIEGDTNDWIRLLGQARLTSPGLFEFSVGPAVRLVESSDVGIREIVLEVRSLDQAREFLASNELLGSMTEDHVMILPEAVQGLDIRLLQSNREE